MFRMASIRGMDRFLSSQSRTVRWMPLRYPTFFRMVWPAWLAETSWLPMGARAPGTLRMERITSLNCTGRHKAGLLPGLGWMQTESAAVTVQKRIRDANQFSVYVVCSAIRTSSYGPAWMVTLAPDADQRNLALGQQLSHLVFRLRTPLTGIYGQPPEYRVSKFFLTAGTRRILFTYDGAALRSYWDGRRGYAMELGPGAALFRHLRQLRQFETPGYKALYYGLIFVPLGCALALATRISKRISALAVGCGLFVPSALLEPILEGLSRRPLYPGNVLLGIGLTTASYAFLRRYLPR